MRWAHGTTFGDRKRLLRELDQARARLSDAPIAQSHYWERRAFDLLASPRVRQAFDLNQESNQVRDRYGRNIHGQCVLLARRLVENGVPLVTVNWHSDGRNFWDTHGNNFNRLRNDLIPPSDQALAALIADLDDRGLLDDTLVIWVGEFGRKPRLTNGTGREHWPFCYSGLMAGGGIAGGAVYGASDKFGEYPLDNPVSPLDLLATAYHALGVPEEKTLSDREGRPRPIYGGKPIMELFG